MNSSRDTNCFFVDAHVVDYLMAAMDDRYHPDSDPDRKLSAERGAAFGLFLSGVVGVAPGGH